jgi:hypothetical protein
MLEVENATIEYTKLGVNHTDHGILSFLIGVDYDGSGQGYGQIVLDTYDEVKGERTPTKLASSLLLAIDRIWGKDWEELIGTPCRSYHDFSHIESIGHFTKDRWLWFDKSKFEFVVARLNEIKED